MRMVYNGTPSGLNKILWDPHFLLPTVRSKFRGIDKGTYTAGRDMGEMFLVFVLSKDSRYYCGVEVSNIQTE